VQPADYTARPEAGQRTDEEGQRRIY